MGNMDSIRDWGYAPEFVEGMWRMLQADAPGDFVLATGRRRERRAVRRGRVPGGRARPPRAHRDRPGVLPPLRGAPPAGRPVEGRGASSAGRRRPSGTSSPGSWSRRTSGCSRTSSPAARSASTADRPSGRTVAPELGRWRVACARPRREQPHNDPQGHPRCPDVTLSANPSRRSARLRADCVPSSTPAPRIGRPSPTLTASSPCARRSGPSRAMQRAAPRAPPTR